MTPQWIALATCIALAGCAAPGYVSTRPEPVLCMTRPQCDAMWSRAQLFVLQKTPLRLQIVTDSVIQTYAPLSVYDSSLGFTITRETAADGSGVIRMQTICGQAAACVPPGTLAGQQFRDYLITTQ